MRSWSLRLRVVAATLAVLLFSLAGFAVAVTLDYREGLESDLRHRLTDGALALSEAPAEQSKQVIGSLAREGIDAQITDAPQAAKTGAPQPAPTDGTSVRTEGNLLVLEAPLDINPAYAKASLVRPQPETIARLTATQDGVDSPVHRLIVAEVVGGLIAVALAALLLLWLLRAALEPLTHVGRVAAQIAGGDRRQRLNPRRTDTELGRMAASFDAMVVALNSSIEQARRSETAMRRFLADASHELRTPIAALHATVETLLREQPPRPERDALEAQLARESARLGALVDDLLNLARLEASEALRREPVDMATLAQQIASETRLDESNVAIDVEATGDTIATGDPEALGRALRNLLDNAVAATDGNGHIRVWVQRSDDVVLTHVSDDGPGVPPHECERIFEGFVRLGDTQRPGAGLGLAIVRRIAEQHRGDVTCDDVTLGACFTLRLPADVSEAATGAPTAPPCER